MRYQGIGLGSMYTYNTQFDIAAGLYHLRFMKSKTSSDSIHWQTLQDFQR